MPLQSEKLRLLRRIPDIRFEEEERGYSKDQVDRVLTNLAPLADEIERIQARLAEAESRASSAEARLVEARSPSTDVGIENFPVQPDFDETLRNTLVSAQRQADTTIREAREEAERLRTEAEFQSNALLADARDQSAEMTTEAVAYRERLMAEAAAERARLLEEATEEARGRVDAVETELAEAHEAERASLIAQIADLTGKHRALEDDVQRFEAHLSSRCDSVRAALAEIGMVLDDPTSLRPQETFEPAELEDFNPDDYPEIAVEVVALEELSDEATQAAAEAAPTEESIAAADLVELDLTSEDGFGGELIDDPAPAYNGNGGEGNGYMVDGGYAAEQDPQLGVQTQVVPNPAVAVADLEPEMEVLSSEADYDLDVEVDESTVLSGAPPWPATENGPTDEAIDEFFDSDDSSDRGGGWFGRRR